MNPLPPSIENIINELNAQAPDTYSQIIRYGIISSSIGLFLGVLMAILVPFLWIKAVRIEEESGSDLPTLLKAICMSLVLGCALTLLYNGFNLLEVTTCPKAYFMEQLVHQQ